MAADDALTKKSFQCLIAVNGYAATNFYDPFVTVGDISVMCCSLHYFTY